MVMSNGCVTVSPYSSANIKEERIIKCGKTEYHYISTNTGYLSRDFIPKKYSQIIADILYLIRSGILERRLNEI